MVVGVGCGGPCNRNPYENLNLYIPMTIF